jgi:GTP:adenosylcobinamide-phosphate guanylyltransferase
VAIRPDLSALCLAAGRGTRLQPITDRVPKPLCPAGPGRRLIDRAIERARRHAGRVAVNAHHHHHQIEAHLRGAGVEVIVETELLGTGGAVGNAGTWIGDDDLLIVNADTVLVAATDEFVAGWDGDSVRMLVVADRERADFDGVWRYVGAALVPNALAVRLPAAPANLSDELFVPARKHGLMELFPVPAFYVDCATPLDLLVANLTLGGGETVVSDGAVMLGRAESSLVMPGAVVAENESLRWAIRLDDGSTVELEEHFR